MTHPLFVAIEGLSGTGKTGVAGVVTQTLGAAHVATVPDAYTPLRRRLDQPEELDARFLLFMSGVTLASLAIRRHLNAGAHVAVESYVARTVAFHRGMGSSVLVEMPGLLLPDVTFHLVCETSERRRRLWARGGDRHCWDSLAEAHEADILAVYRQFGMHRVDTTKLSLPVVADAVLRHPLDGSCRCADVQPVGSYQNLLSVVPRRVG